MSGEDDPKAEDIVRFDEEARAAERDFL